MSTRRSSRSRAQKVQAAPPTAAPCLLNSPVLPVLLQHPCMRHVSIICSLLCTAKALEQPIAQYLRGQLAVQCNVQQKGAGSCQLRSDFIDWLAQHACLAMSLQLQLHPAYQATCSSLAGIAAALKLAGKQRSSSSNAAAAGGRGLALVSFEAPASTVALLQALPAATLTRLDPGTLVHAELDERITAPRKALQRLTSLQELVLHQGDANTLLQATSKLLQLRRLSAQQLSAAGVGAFKHLPPQLQSCTFTADLSGGMTGLPAEEETIAAVTLGHITGLTELRCERYMLEGTTFDLQPGDMVPRSLRRLTLSSVESIQQLADLSALETLELWSAEIMASEVLRQISSLTHIMQLRLGYFPRTPERIEEHANVWPDLPALKGLDIQWHLSEEVMPSLVVSQLQRCTGLTQLGIEIEHEDSWIEGTAAQFAQALAQLKQLRELRLAGYGFTFEEEDARFHHMSDTQVVLSSLAQLPGLRSLALLRLDLTDDRAVPAGATILDDLGLLTQLSRLELECCETWSEHELYPSCLCMALLQLTQLPQLHVLRMALHPAMVDGWAAKHAAQMGQLKRVECFVEDFDSAKLSWAGRPDVHVEHIEPDGSTTHVCGGGCLEG